MRIDTTTFVAAIAAVLSFLLALLIGSRHQIGGWGVETDFYYMYLPQAREFLDGPPYLANIVHNPPGYSLLVGLIGRLVGGEFAAAKLVAAAASGAFVWTVFCLVNICLGKRTALLVAGFLVAALVPFSYLAGTDVLGALVITAPILWLVSRRQLGTRQAFGAGLMVGLAYLVRSNAIVLVPVLWLAIAWSPLRSGSGSSRRVTTGLFGVAFLLAIAPWLVLNAIANGSPMASTVHLQVGSHFFGSNAGDAYGITAFHEAASRFKSLGEVLAFDPLRFGYRYLKGLFIDNPSGLLSNAALFPGVLLVGLGTLGILRSPNRSTIVWLAVVGASLMLLALVGFYPRYYLFAYPWVFILMVLGAMEIERAVTGPAARLRYLGWGLLAVSFLVVAGSSFRATRAQFEDEPRGLIPLAASIRLEAGSDDLMVSRKPHLAALAGVKWMFPSANTAEELLAEAKRAGAKYLVYSEFEERIWPALSAFRDPDRLLGAPLVKRFTDESTGTIVYELVLQ